MAAIASVNPSGYSPSTLQVVRPGVVAAEYPAPATIQVRFKTHRAMRMAVARCTHSEVDAHDKLLLNCIAEHANKYGYGARPGNETLQEFCALKWCATHDRLRNLVNLGLIERTGKGGRGWAATYRLCLESEYFSKPEDEVAAEDDAPLVSAISREGNHTAMSRIVSGEEKHQGTDRNHTAEGQKPYGCEEKPYGHSRSTTYTATETTAEETSTSTSKQKERKVNRARDRETVPSNKEGSPPRESRQEAASARPGEPSDQTGSSLPFCSDVDVDKGKRANRERQGRKGPWDIDDLIEQTRAMHPEEDPDMLFCWIVFDSWFGYPSGFKNALDGDRTGFMKVAHEAYEYAKENWDWHGNAVTGKQIPPYADLKGVVRFMGLVADRLKEGEIYAPCFFAALSQARAERKKRGH